MKMHKKTKFLYAMAIVVAAIFICMNFVAVLAETTDPDKEEIDQLNDQVSEKKSIVETLNSQISAYQKKIVAKQAQIISLKDQMAVIENRIAKAELDIQLVKTEIEAINLELQLLEKQIGDKAAQITIQKETLSKLIRRINKLDQRSYLEVLLANNSFSEFFDQLKHIEDIQADLQGSLDEVQSLKSDLEDKLALRESKKDQLNETKEKLEQQKDSLAEENNLKEILVADSQSSEAMYQELLNDLRQERQYIDSQVTALENSIRDKIEAMDEAFADGGGETVLSWPASPARGITAYFHDPTYPFRHLFEHSGIDLRLYQGTPIKSSAPGYVVWAKQGRSYGNFVMIMHADGISTVYAHLSQINVNVDQFVERGQVIGLSGGMPGTPGAGLSTGPHLHFEVRESGIPVNPLNYLIEP